MGVGISIKGNRDEKEPVISQGLSAQGEGSIKMIIYICSVELERLHSLYALGNLATDKEYVHFCG